MGGRGASVAVQKLTAGYGRIRVLEGIDLEIDPGIFVALLGSSGCGKTTLLRAISGFVQPTGGHILVDGRDITDTGPDRRGMAMVFQSYALWPHMSVAQNIGYGLRLRGWSRADIARRVEEMLVLLDLRGYGDRKVTALSGGQRQRVALGRALAVDPPVLLLDEPLSNLDAKIRLSMRHEIRALHNRIGFTAIHVTHDQEEAMVMADRIVILDRGRIAQDGAPEEVYRRPNSRMVASFLGADNIVRGTARRSGDDVIIEVEGGATVVLPGRLAPEGGCVLQFRGSDVSFGPTAEGGLHLPGMVEQQSYPGGRYRYAVSTPAGTFLVDDATRIAPGERVNITIPADALHLFERSPDEVAAAAA